MREPPRPDRALRRPRRPRNLLSALAGLGLVAAVLVGARASSAAALASVAWTVSDSTAGATGVAYAYNLTAATAANVTSITVTVPPGTGGTPSLDSASWPYGSSPGNAAVALSGTTLTYSFDSIWLAAGGQVSFRVSGLTNTETPGSYASDIATNGGGNQVDAGTSASVPISGGALGSPGWSVSSSAAGGADVSYTYSFTTASDATLTSVTMSVPAGTGGTPTVGSVGGLPDSGSVSLSGGTLTYGGFSESVDAGTAISIRIDGMTNTSTAGSYTAQLATDASGDPIDTGVTGSVSFSAASLTSPTWSVSDSTAGATGVAYTYTFTMSGASLTSLTMSVPAGTGGTPALGALSSPYGGIPSGGDLSLSGTTLTYAFSSTYVNGGQVSIEVTGLTNTSTPGGYTSQIAINGGGPIASGITGSVSISGGALSSPIWTVSDPGSGATGVDYTYSFTTASAATLASVTMTVPPGTGGTPAVGAVSGVPAGGTVSLAGDTLTYAFPATSVSAATSVSIRIGGMTNASTGSYTSQIATHSAGAPVDTGVTAPVSISGGTLTSPIWTVSDPATSADGVAYTYTFSTATGASIESVTMTVPPGTAGTPAVGTVSGLSSGTVSLSGGTLTYTVATPAWINQKTAVSIEITGMTNTATAGSYTSQLTTRADSGGTTVPEDTGITAAVAISGGGTLASPIWSVSGSVAGAKGVAYTYSFATATTATLASVTMTVPPGTAGTPAVGAVSGVPAGGTVSLAGGALTYSFGATSVDAGTAVSIRITGMTNTSETGSYTSQLATHTTGAPVDTGTTAPIALSGGALVGPIWSVSDSAAGDTGVVYTYAFTTATGASLTSVTMTVPPGTAGTPAVGTVSGLSAGTVSLSGNTLTYTIATPAWINQKTAVSIEITGLTNTATPGNYTAQLATHTTSGPNDTGVTGSLAFSGGTLASPIWTVSNPATSATGVAYTYTFTTASPATLSSVTMGVPPGTAGAPTVGAVSGIPGTGQVTLASNVLTYDGFSKLVPAGTAVSIEIKGLTNTSTVGSYTSQIATSSDNGPVDSGVTAPASISGGTLTAPGWVVSTPSAGASGVAYTYTFVTHSGSSLGSVTMTVPPGTGGTPAVGAVSGVGTGSVSLAGNTLTYEIDSPTWVNPKTAVSIRVSGMTNTATAGSYGAQITTRSNGKPPAPVDTGFTGHVRVAPGGAYTAYVADSGDSTVTPITVGAGGAGDAIEMGGSPWAIAIAPDAKTAYVADSSGGTLTPIALAGGKAGTAIPLGGCSAPKAVAVAPDGTKAYVACSGNAKVVPVGLPGGAVGTAIAVGSAPLDLALAPDGGTAYVVASGADALTPIALPGGTAGAAIPLTGCTTPDAIAIAPDGKTAYVACSGNARVVPVALPGGAVGTAIPVGSDPADLAVSPDGSTAYVANAGSGTVTPIALASDTAGTAIAVGSLPQGVAIAPDGATAYVTDGADDAVTPIDTSSDSAEAPIAVGSEPVGVVFTPDQAPVAAMSVTAGAPGAATHFDASASGVAYGTIVSYSWDFGDGTTKTGSSPTTTHVYAAGCSYTATLTETDSAGTSTSQVFTGQTASRNGGPAARTTASVGVTRGVGFVSPPADIAFSGTLSGVDQALTSTLPLDVGDGTGAAGWSISATSTTFTTGGGTPRTLPSTAVTVTSAPAAACDGAADCTKPSTGVDYPYVLPAGATAPPATELYDAAAGSGVCDQTVTPTFTLTVPSEAYAGTYSSTWTFTLASGP